MIINPIRELPEELKDFVYDLVNSNEKWYRIKELVEIEFDKDFLINPKMLHEWCYFSYGLFDNYEWLNKQIINYGFRFIESFFRLEIETIKFLEEKSINYILIKNLISNTYDLYFHKDVDENIIRLYKIIFIGKYNLINELKWLRFPLSECKLLISEINNNSNQSISNTEPIKDSYEIINSWINENYLKFRVLIFERNIHFQKEEDFIIFKLKFV